MPTIGEDALRNAIARNSAVVLSLPSAGMFRHHPSRFLGELERGILVQAPADEMPLVDELIHTGNPCGVTFKHGVNKVTFAARVRRLEPRWRLRDQTHVSAMLIDFPAEIKSIHRRDNYRVKLRATAEVTARLWRIAKQAAIAENPMPHEEIKVELRDIGLGGIGVKLLTLDGHPPCISKADRLRIQLTHRGSALLLEGQMRDPTPTPENDAIITGIQFKKLEDDLAGRRTLAHLARIVGKLQRDEARRVKLGTAKVA